MSGMNGISTFIPITITADHNATVLIAIGQKVGLEFSAEAVKHSRFLRQPRNTEKKCAEHVQLYLTLTDHLRFFIQSQKNKTGESGQEQFKEKKKQ